MASSPQLVGVAGHPEEVPAPERHSRTTYQVGMTRQAVAKHLAILEKANLLSWKRQGREKFHFINPVPINDIAERWISKFERQRLTALSELKKKLERKSDD